LLYSLIPLLLWASVRFGLAGLNASILTIALISIWNAMHGRDPFISGSVGQNVFTLKAYLVAVAVPLMFLSTLLPEMRRTSRKLIDAREQERQDIARELHDDVVQQLVLIGLEVEGLKSGSSQKLLLDELYKQVSNVTEATRKLSHDLYPFALRYVGLTKAIRNLCLQTGEAASITINFAQENVPPLAADISLCLYRIAQEALQNIIKHSHAHNAAVELRVHDGQALLRIVDDGVGMIPEQEHIGCMGLNGMRERVMALRGTLKITSAPTRGTTIEGAVPLK
jgi:two-component system sensor histidine kinase UhpB